MRNIIITTSIVFIAVIVTSYFYFSNLRRDDLIKPDEAGNIEANQRVGDETPTEHTTLWSFALNAQLSNKPIVCDLDSANRFILVQDAYHILYAISADGQQLWNAQLPGPILDSIQQLADLSLVFTTAQRLYRIDTEGDPLPGFSLQLPHKATHGATVWPEDEGVLRIEVPSKNRVLSFDGSGTHLRNQRHKATAEDMAPGTEAGRQDLENSRPPSLPSGCGPLFYYGQLDDGGGNYLLCSKGDQQLHCYRY